MDMKATGQLIAKRRKEKGLSQAELAERIHVTDKAISRWETGRGMPALESVGPLAEALELTVGELLGETGVPNRELMEGDLGKRGWSLWPYHVISVLWAFGYPIGLFRFRVYLATSDIWIDARSLAIGAVGGFLLSGVLYCLKKNDILLIFSVILPLFWFVVPGDNMIASVLLGAGVVCCVAAFPRISSFLSRISY